MPMLSPQSVPQSQSKTLIHPHEQCSVAFEQWSRVMEYITLHWKASSQLKSLASKPAADPNLLRLLNAAVNRPSNEGEGDHVVHHNGNKDILNSRGISTESSIKTLIPWMPEDKIYSPSLLGLHEEMEDFYNYMAPLPEEKYMRNEIVNRLRQIVNSLWANAEVKVYGSFETGLYLPTSDIDVVIKCPDLEPLTALTLLEQSLIKQGDCDDVKVIRTSVPIVKFTDKSTATKVDVSVNIEGALSSAEFIKEMMATYPELKYLGFVLKQFLTSRGLLESFNGGISSYCLVLLIVSYLQLHPEDRSSNNHGIRLIKFLELYGRHFNYLNCGIRVTDGGSYFRKGENNMGDKFSLLCVEDPFNAENDVGQSCFGAMKVREEFDRAFRELCDGVLPQYSHLQPRSTSLLGRILTIAPEVVAYRRFVFERYHHLCQPSAMGTPFFLPPPGLRSYINTQVQQPVNHFNPSFPPNHHQFATPPYQAGQGQQQLNYSHQQLPPTAVPPLHLFQQHQLPFMTIDGLQQSQYRYSQYSLPSYLLSNVIAQSLPTEGVYSNQMPPLQIQPSYSEDRSDSDSLSSQQSNQSSQLSQGPLSNIVSNSKVSSDGDQDLEASSVISLVPLPPQEPALSITTSLDSMTTSVTSTYQHVNSLSNATSSSSVEVTSSHNYFVNRNSKSNGNGVDHSNRSSSSNSLDTLCEITDSRHSQNIKSNNSYHSQHDRYHPNNRSSGYLEEPGNRSHHVQRTNSSKHNSSKTFYPAIYSRSSPPLDSARSLHQSRQGGNRSGTNHRNNQISIASSSASMTTSAHLTESSPRQKGKTQNFIPSHSPASVTTNQQSSSTSIINSSQHSQQYHRPSGNQSQSKSSRKSSAHPPSSNNFSRGSFKNQKISPSSSSSSSSCSPTYSPAVMAVSAVSR